MVTDNDFPVTQSGSGEQFDRCTNAAGSVGEQVTPGAACPDGPAVIPTLACVFRASGSSLAAAGNPEPATWALMIGGFGLVGLAARRRRAVYGIG